MTDNDDNELTSDELRISLNSLLTGSVALMAEAVRKLPVAEQLKLHEQLDRGDTAISVTMLLPQGAIRVAIVGPWPGEKLLWEMTPDGPVLVRPTNG